MSDIQSGKQIFIGFTVDTNFQSVWCKKIALSDQREFILANCYFKTIKQTTVFENENSFKIYLVIIMLNMHKHISKKIGSKVDCFTRLCDCSIRVSKFSGLNCFIRSQIICCTSYTLHQLHFAPITLCTSYTPEYSLTFFTLNYS